MKKLIPILFISSIILSGCGSKKNNTEISQTETDISSSELTTKIDDNLCALEYDTVSFETMTAFLNSNKTRSSYAVPEYDEEKYEFYRGQTYQGGYSVAFKEIASGNTIVYSATCRTYYHDFESMVKSCKSNVEEEFMLDYIEVNAFGRQALYSTDGMTTALEFMYDEDTKIYFQVPGNLSEEAILTYAEDFVF